MITIREHIPLDKYTTLKAGGTARFFVSVASEGELTEALVYARERGLSVYLLGGGSNVLVSDAGLNGLVIKMEIRGVTYTDLDSGRLKVRAGSGESWDELVKQVSDKGFYGIENLSGIPGTVGAAPVQNIGAYGVELGSVVDTVDVIDIGSGEHHTLSREECRFSYRHSIFKDTPGRFVITHLSLIVSRSGAPVTQYKDLAERCRGDETPREMRDHVLSVREGKFPDLNAVGTAGSFFKNPVITVGQYERLREEFGDIPSYPLEGDRVKVPLAWILDRVLGMKGAREGQVGLFERQPLVLVNYGSRKSEPIISFARTIVDKVYARTGITIEYEVRVLE